jgi:hypothetical protein
MFTALSAIGQIRYLKSLLIICIAIIQYIPHNSPPYFQFLIIVQMSLHLHKEGNKIQSNDAET